MQAGVAAPIVAVVSKLDPHPGGKVVAAAPAQQLLFPQEAHAKLKQVQNPETLESAT